MSGRYEQCGGLSCEDAVLCGDHAWATCPDGFICLKQSEFYHQVRTEQWMPSCVYCAKLELFDA